MWDWDNNSLHLLIFSFDAGFMMECSTWSGAESLNLQFMVPKVRICYFIKTYNFLLYCKWSTYNNAKKNVLTWKTKSFSRENRCFMLTLSLFLFLFVGHIWGNVYIVQSNALQHLSCINSAGSHLNSQQITSHVSTPWCCSVRADDVTFTFPVMPFGYQKMTPRRPSPSRVLYRLKILRRS